MTTRPIFMVRNRIYVSAGTIFYTNDEQGNIKFLIQQLGPGQKNSWKYEDFGGKSEVGDESLHDVAFRECCEEMNFGKPFHTESLLRECLKDKRSIIYTIPEDKYMLYILYINKDTAESLDLDSYGTINNDSTPRRVVWITYKELMELNDSDLHPRLHSNQLKVNLSLTLSVAKSGESQYY